MAIDSGGMSSKQQQSIRGTIHLLLSLLNECGVPKVASECFRRAKFNQEDVMDLWKLTFHIMQAVTFLDSDMCDGNLHEVVYHSITASNMRTVQMILRRYLFEQGYHRVEFYTPLGSGVPSREVLLAFGWLLHRTALFAKLRRHFLMAATRHRIPTKQSHQHLIEHVIEESGVMGREIEGVVRELRKSGNNSSTCECVEALQKLVWFKGSLDSKWRAVQRVCLAHRVLSDRIHRYTSVTSPISRTAKGYLSPHEVFLVRYPDQMKAHLSQLRQCVRILEKLIQWGDSEPLFWQWMESILDLQEEEKGKRLNQEEEVERTTIPEYDHLQSTMCQLQEEFEGLLSRNKPHTDRVVHVWAHKASILPHKDLNGRLQRVRSQLQFEYPIAVPPSNQTALVTLSVEQIDPIDRAVYTPVHTIVRTTGATSVPLQPDSDARLVSVHVLSKHLQTVSQELKELDGEIGWRKGEIGNALESLEKTLPAAVCKIESNLQASST